MLNEEQEKFWNQNDANYRKIMDKEMKMITVNFIISCIPISFMLVSGMFLQNGIINLASTAFITSIILSIPMFLIFRFINKNLEIKKIRIWKNFGIIIKNKK